MDQPLKDVLMTHDQENKPRIKEIKIGFGRFSPSMSSVCMGLLEF